MGSRDGLKIMTPLKLINAATVSEIHISSCWNSVQVLYSKNLWCRRWKSLYL